MKFRERMQRCMYGRYGTDMLNRFLLGIVIVLLVLDMALSIIFKVRIPFVGSITLILLILSYYRMFSRNISKRYEENEKYLRIRNKLTGFFSLKKKHMEERKYYRFFACPNCKQKVRVPKGKGLIEITCPRCRTSFRKRS